MAHTPFLLRFTGIFLSASEATSSLLHCASCSTTPLSFYLPSLPTLPLLPTMVWTRFLGSEKARGLEAKPQPHHHLIPARAKGNCKSQHGALASNKYVLIGQSLFFSAFWNWGSKPSYCGVICLKRSGRQSIMIIRPESCYSNTASRTALRCSLPLIVYN